MAEDRPSLDSVSQVLASAYDEDNHASLDPVIARLMIQLSHVSPVTPEPQVASPASRWRRLRFILRRRR